MEETGSQPLLDANPSEAIALRSSIPQQFNIAPEETAEKDLYDVYSYQRFELYQYHRALGVIYIILSILTLGILPLVFARWFSDLTLKMTHTRARQFKKATAILFVSKAGVKTVCYTRTQVFGERLIRMFTYRQANYIMDDQIQLFYRTPFNVSLAFSEIHEKFGNVILTDEQRDTYRKIFGKNDIDVPVESVLTILLNETLNVFYIFQIFAIFVWMWDQYYYYAGAILVISVVSAIFNVVQTKVNQVRLRKISRHVCDVKRLEQESFDTEPRETIVQSDKLVPGDLVVLSDELTMPCDVILTQGQCVVNESMLTGESTPTLKTTLPKSDSSTLYSKDIHKVHTIYGGTSIVQTKGRAVGLVIGTGFSTSKGSMVLSIMYPKPDSFKFYTDSVKFLILMLVFALVSFIYSGYQLYKLGVPAIDIVKRALDVITIAIPPALPIAMTVGVSYAIERMRKKKIFCTSPPRVNVAGKVKILCFDKTGTLTEDGLDMHNVLPATAAAFTENIPASSVHHALESLVASNDESKQMIAFGLAACHSLTHVGARLVGDPLDVKLFEATGWTLNEITEGDRVSHEVRSKSGKAHLQIVRQFEFLSTIKRMSVLVQDKFTGKYYVLVKGAPEVIKSLCGPNTIPSNFENVLKSYAHQGYRVIAFASKPFIPQQGFNPELISREEIESNLEFQGFASLHNQLKSDSKATIQDLKNAHITNIMVTGDNALTAISVAKQCNMIDFTKKVFLGTLTEHRAIRWDDIDDTGLILDPVTLLPSVGSSSSVSLSSSSEHKGGEEVITFEKGFEIAVTGDAFQYLVDNSNQKSFNAILDHIIGKCRVYARMAPQQKQKLVELIGKQNSNALTGMCGDGGNDCGALKAAHIGVSLSSASEASVAAPFTSMEASIACVPTILREGRAALATSFQTFKYMAAYSFIQTVSVIILYHINSNMGDFQFLFVDMLVVFPTMLLLGNTKASSKLTKNRPPSSIFSVPILISMAGQALLVIIFQLIVFLDVRSQSFYKFLSTGKSPKSNTMVFESNVIFYMNAFQTLAITFSYNIAKPFKKPLYTNVVYLLSLLALLLLLIYLIVYPAGFLMKFLDFLDIPLAYRFRILLYCAIFFVCSYLYELFWTSFIGRKIIKTLNCKK